MFIRRVLEILAREVDPPVSSTISFRSSLVVELVAIDSLTLAWRDASSVSSSSWGSFVVSVWSFDHIAGMAGDGVGGGVIWACADVDFGTFMRRERGGWVMYGVILGLCAYVLFMLRLVQRQ